MFAIVFDTASQHKFNQRPGCTELRNAEIAPRQCANIRPLVSHVLCD
jgi:hypothetical protein